MKTHEEQIIHLYQELGRLADSVATVNQYLAAGISSIQDRIGRLEAENAELRRYVGLPEQ